MPLARSGRRSTVVKSQTVASRETERQRGEVIGVERPKLAGVFAGNHQQVTFNDVELVQQANMAGRQIGHVQRRFIRQERIARSRSGARRCLPRQLANNPHAKLCAVVGHRADERRDRNQRPGIKCCGRDTICECEKRIHIPPLLRKRQISIQGSYNSSRNVIVWQVPLRFDEV